MEGSGILLFRSSKNETKIGVKALFTIRDPLKNEPRKRKPRLLQSNVMRAILKDCSGRGSGEVHALRTDLLRWQQFWKRLDTSRFGSLSFSGSCRNSMRRSLAGERQCRGREDYSLRFVLHVYFLFFSFQTHALLRLPQFLLGILKQWATSSSPLFVTQAVCV